MAMDAQVEAVAAFKDGWGESAPPAPATEDEKLWGMLANFLGLFFIVGPLVAWFVKGDSRFVKFHALQMIFLNLVGFVVGIVLGICLTMLAMVPFVGMLVGTVVGPLFSLAMLVLLVFLGLKAKSGAIFKLPVLGAYACKSVYEVK